MAVVSPVKLIAQLDRVRKVSTTGQIKPNPANLAPVILILGVYLNGVVEIESLISHLITFPLQTFLGVQ